MSKNLYRVEALALPPVLPSSDAMKSWGENEHSYDPEFWSFIYSARRYLGRVSDADLHKRYGEIVRNMNALVTPERHVIPIFSFLSSWYWFRKEHITRLELYIRGREPNCHPHSDLLALDRPTSPYSTKHPNSQRVLFRYGQRLHQEELVNLGRIRIAAAQIYVDMENDDARQDDELNKHEFMPGEFTKITTLDGKPIPIIGDLKRTVSLPNYYVLCMSHAWDPDLLKEFGDTCVVIIDTDEFARRVDCAAREELREGWYFHWCPIEYFDPYEKPPKQAFDAAMSKDFRFAYQREYRFVWLSQKGEAASGYRFLNAGPMGDIAKIHD